MIGFALPFMTIPVLPEMIETAVLQYGDKHKEKIGDLSAGIFTCFIGIG